MVVHLWVVKHWALSISEKNPEISVGAKVEFPIGKKLFHLVLNPGTSRCPTVDLELVQTTRNVNGTRHSVQKFQPGKRAHLFRFYTFSGNFPVGRADETCLPPNQKFREFWLNGKRPLSRFHGNFRVNVTCQFFALFTSLLDWIVPIDSGRVWKISSPRTSFSRTKLPLAVQTDDVTSGIEGTWIRTGGYG